jgi:hypothetical protein
MALGFVAGLQGNEYRSAIVGVWVGYFGTKLVRFSEESLLEGKGNPDCGKGSKSVEMFVERVGNLTCFKAAPPVEGRSGVNLSGVPCPCPSPQMDGEPRCGDPAQVPAEPA